MAVLNRTHHGVPPGAVYIGRGTPWGNPFVMGVHGDRDAVCDAYAAYLKTQIRSGQISLQALASLHNKDLVCHCAPKRCHGDALTRVAAWAHAQLHQPR